MGPVPNWNRTIAAMNVVTFASTIVLKALVKPASIAARTVTNFQARTVCLLAYKLSCDYTRLIGVF